MQLRERRPFTQDAAYEKIVEGGRGGWCYEMNGLFALMLKELGFTFDFIAAGVGRDKRGDSAMMNHLAMVVHLEQPYLADVGFGTGSLNPIPLQPGEYHDGRATFSLKSDGDWWRVCAAGGQTYDFTTAPREYHAFEHRARLLATTAESMFVQNLVVIQLREDGMSSLINSAFKAQSATEILEETAPTQAELTRILNDEFNLQVNGMKALWQRVAAQQKAAVRRKLRGF